MITNADRLAEIAASRIRLIRTMLSSPSGAEWCERHTELADEVVRLVHRSVVESLQDDPPVSIIATGGYGRRELAPHSDIDLTVVPLDESHPGLDSLIRALFRELHEAFGTHLRMDVGYAYRLISDAPGLDAKTRTALLDSRLVSGAHRPLDSLMESFWATFPVGEFLIAKIEEREAAQRKTNDTPLAVEPHLKDGAGGLRSFHAANWLGAAIGDRPARPSRFYERVLTMRNVLHVVAGKRVDVLTRQRQGEIAEALGEDMFALTSKLAESLEELDRVYARAVEKLHDARYTLAPHVEAIRGEVRIAGSAPLGEAAVGISMATRLGLRVADLKASTTPHLEAGKALFAIRAGEGTLRNLDRCGLLEALLPELTACRTLMPRDGSHAFTVYEHTLRAVRRLDEIARDTGYLGSLFETLQDPSLLYLAALLHDSGKIQPDEDHSEVGGRIAVEVARRWGLDSFAQGLLEWLVREHLTMARFIRMRDLHQPDTIREFAQIVEDRERLTMLALLTVADVSAVGPDNWTPVQEAFLKELYDQTASLLEGGADETPDPGIFRQRVLRKLQKEPFPEEEVRSFLDSLPASYLVSTPPEIVREHFAFARQALQGRPVVEIFHQIEMGASDVTICQLDSPGLLSRVLGVFYAFDLSMVGLRACTTRSEPAIAIDVFTVTFGGRPLPPATCAHLASALQDVLNGRTSVDELISRRGKDPSRMQSDFSFTYIEGTPGILEVRAPRGRGMAYRFSRMIASQGWNIQAARVGQWAGLGAAAFYILGPGDRPLRYDEVSQALSRRV